LAPFLGQGPVFRLFWWYRILCLWALRCFDPENSLGLFGKRTHIQQWLQPRLILLPVATLDSLVFPLVSFIFPCSKFDFFHPGAANQECWPAQSEMEGKIIEAFRKEGVEIIRGHPFDEKLKHGFIYNQRMGIDVFRNIPTDVPVIVAEAVWQYSYHVLAGLRDHTGPILTIANWSGQWPGLVGLLNLNASLTKMKKPFSSIWSENFDDEFFLRGIREWIKEGNITHDLSHVKPLDLASLPKEEVELGHALAQTLLKNKAIMGVSLPYFPLDTFSSHLLLLCLLCRSSMKVVWACTTPSSMMNS
jgi:hypothetical protein